MHQSLEVADIVIGVVDGVSVIPKHDVARAPTVAHAVFGARDMAEEDVKKGAAVVRIEPLDPGREPGIDEEALASGLGMDPYDGMFNGVESVVATAFPLIAVPTLGEGCGELVTAVVESSEAVGKFLERAGEGVVGCLKARPARIATELRQLDRTKD